MVRSEDEAPELTLSVDEPLPLPAAAARGFVDENSLRVLRRLAGAEVDPVRARAALERLLGGVEVASHELPDTKTMVVGLTLAMVRHGVPAKVLVDSIMDCFE